MEEQNITQKSEKNIDYVRVFWSSSAFIVITVLIVGSGTYLWQDRKLKTLDKELQPKISSLHDQNEILQNQIASLHDQNEKLKRENFILSVKEKSTFDTRPLVTDSIELPIVVYSRLGLLNSTPEGRGEKIILEEKLIKPYMDYYNKEGVFLITLKVTVPEYIGDQYVVEAIFKNGGHSSFLFGEREGSYDYWEANGYID